MQKHRLWIAAAGFALLATPAAAEDTGYWHKSDRLTLPGRSNRGYTREQIMKRAKLNVAHPRPPAVATLPPAGRSEREGSLACAAIPVRLKEEAHVARIARIRFGLPLPEGALFRTDRIRLLDPAGTEHRAQFAVTGYWPDQSLKWVLVQFSAPLQPGEETEYRLECGSEVRRRKFSSIAAEEDERKITIDTGVIQAVIDKRNFNFIRALRYQNNWIGGFSPAGAVLREGAEKRDYLLSKLPPERIEIIESGPERLTVRAAGRYGAAESGGRKSCMSYVARLSFSAGSAGFELEFTHLNTELEHEFTDLEKLEIEFEPADGIERGTADIEGKEPVELNANGRIFQETDQFYSLGGGSRTAGRIGGSATIGGADGTGWSIGIADAWQRYPKAISRTDRQCRLELLPEQPDRQFNRDLPYYLVYPFCEGAYRMKWGMSFTERLRFEPQADPAAFRAELNCPVIAVLPPDWYARTKAAPGLGIAGFEAIDRKIISSFDLRLDQAAEQREYGFFNYGDSFGEKGENWTNNEYDLAYGLFLTFLRTGHRPLFRHALTAARHQADVDTVHAYPDPYYIGGNLNHGAGHTGRYKVWSFPYGYYQSAANGHTWTGGMLAAWQLAGDAMVMDAVGLAGNHIALAMTPNFAFGKNPQAPRECAWAVRALLQLYSATLDPVYLNAAKNLTVKAVQACRNAPGGVWALVNTRLKKARGDETLGNVTFILALGLKGLCDYYRATGDETLKPAIRAVARQTMLAFEPDDGSGFAYDLSHDGRKLNYAATYLNPTIAPPLAEAAVILKDTTIRDVARRAMAVSFLQHPGFTGKFLGEYLTFLADYLRSLRDWPAADAGDFSDQALIAEALPDGSPLWHWRAPDPGRFLVRLRADQAELALQRWIWPVPKKNDFDAAIRILNAAGELIHEQKIDANADAMRLVFPLTGRPGDEFTVVVRDYANADWCVVPSAAIVHAGIVENAPLRLARNGLSRFYFEVPAGKTVHLEYYGTHVGGYGAWLYDETGTVIDAAAGRMMQSAMQKAPRQTIRLTVPAAPRRRVCSIVSWAVFDAQLRLRGSSLLSGTREFFSP